MIKNLTLEHKGGYYSYRVHDIKAKELCNGFSSLKNYLDDMFTKCPNEYFNSGPRSSGLRFRLNNLKIHQVSGHEINELTKQALVLNKERFNEKHPRVQVFLLENDDKTIAMEVPIWLKFKELKDFTSIFRTISPLTGHIDILRVDDNKIWVWDYKPQAYYERYAATQVYFYALMLSKRTNINLENFRCGYFDDKYAYFFKPDLSLIETKPILEFV